eukprot:1187621-Prorocentrum_minimum.AAC.1
MRDARVYSRDGPIVSRRLAPARRGPARVRATPAAPPSCWGASSPSAPRGPCDRPSNGPAPPAPRSAQLGETRTLYINKRHPKGECTGDADPAFLSGAHTKEASTNVSGENSPVVERLNKGLTSTSSPSGSSKEVGLGEAEGCLRADTNIPGENRILQRWSGLTRA